mmetsp:Transcript_42836/g.127993  ORF Transcript_42836/g.127993 Transcript_42836/m.127993 type:complete len:209 (+) Transcript_42836:775-1401(+)
MSLAPLVAAAPRGAASQSRQKSSLCLSQCHRAPFRGPARHPEQQYSRYLAWGVQAIAQPPVGHRTVPWELDELWSLSSSPAGCPLRAVSRPSACARAGSRAGGAEGDASGRAAEGAGSTGSCMGSAVGEVSNMAPEGVATNLASPGCAARATFVMTSRSFSAATLEAAVLSTQPTHSSHSHSRQPKTICPGFCMKSHLSQRAALQPTT